MTLKFKEYDDVVFRKAPLVNVISQIKFERVLSLMSDIGIVGFQEGLRSIYPIISNIRTGQLNLSGQAGTINKVGFTQPAPIWQFSDEKNDWLISLGVDFVALEASGYLDFDEFLERFMFVLDTLDRTVNVSKSTRIGLRKINLITYPDDFPPIDWKLIIIPQLVGPAGMSLPCDVMRSISELNLKQGSNHIRVSYGLIQKIVAEQFVSHVEKARCDTTIAKDAMPEDSTQVFLLDLDCSTMENYAVGKRDDLAELLTEFSNRITSFFHLSITDEYYNWLEPEKRGNAKN